MANALPKLTLVVALLVAAVAGIPPASAATTDEQPLRATSLAMGQTNGTVYAVRHAQGRLFAAGSFTSVRPPGAAEGEGEIAQAYLAAFDATTGAVDTGFRHTFTNTYDGSPGVVHSLAVSPDGTRLYVGGDFNNIDGIRQEHIAAFDTATGALLPDFGAAGVNGRVYALAAEAGVVYVGGRFGKSTWRVRDKVAAFTPAGKILPWAPKVVGSATTGQPTTVYALATSPDATRVYIGGSFDTVNSVAVHGLARVDSVSGELLPYASVVPDTSYVTSLTTDDQRLYVTGRDDKGTSRFEGVKALDFETGATLWFADCAGDTFAALPLGGVVYVATHAHDCSRIAGWPNRSPRTYTSMYTLDAATGRLLPFNPTMSGSSTVPGSLDNTRSLATDGTQLFVGGGWLKVDGVAQANLARFGPTGAGKAPERPYATARVDSTGKIVVRWRTVADKDDRRLTYLLYRGYSTTSPLFTATVDSVFWNRTGMSFVDTAAVEGTSTFYRIAVSDGRNRIFSVNTAKVMPGAAATTYVGAAKTDAPTSYWRLNDGTSTIAEDATGASRTGAYLGTVVRGIGSALLNDDTDRAISLDGADDRVASNHSYFDPASYSVELWVRTSSAYGGRVAGFGSSKTGTSQTFDRHLYYTNDGRIVFGVDWLGPKTVVSPLAYNDGRWHHVVATQDAGGMRLYVDGVQVAHDPAVIDARGYFGHWRLGSDNLNGWPDKPTASGLVAGVDEAAVYPVALTAAEVAQHYAVR